MQLLHGDCLELMKDIPDKSIDMILCDPPYGIDFQSKWRKDKEKRKPKVIGDKEISTEFIPEFRRIISSSGSIMIFTRWDVQQRFIDEMNKNNLKVKNVLIWDKKIHGMGDLKRSYGSRYESIIFHSEPEFLFNGKRPVDIISAQRISATKLLHPNEKPVELLEILIQQCAGGGKTVLDCFMGSGSTGVACVNTGRDFIGIELDKNYYNIAVKRIKEARARKEMEDK